MFQLIDAIHELGLCVPHANLVIHERSVHIQKHIFIQSDRQNESSMFLVERRKICAPAAKSQSKRSSRQNHLFFPVLICCEAMTQSKEFGVQVPDRGG